MHRKLLTLVVLSAIISLCVSAAENTNAKFSSPLRLLQAAHRNPSLYPKFIRSAAEASEIKVLVQFADPADPAIWESRGIRLRKIGNIYAGSGSVYGATMSWEEIERWAQEPGVLMIASDWHPKIVPCLDVSAPEVGAPEVWEMINSQGLPITGAGQLVADFDTGIDIFHPAFFRPTEQRYNWLDEDSNGVFTSGVDVVDLNGNGVGEREELLRLLDGQIYDPAMTFGGNGISNADSIYQSDWDWLFNDADDDGQRDCGTQGGFTENDPGYGEMVFHLDDLNSNHSLDLGEQLILLGQSKARAVWDNSGVRRRGVDLIQATPDYDGHGTAVCGILAGGEPGCTRFCGLAPGADLLVGYTSGGWFSEILPWVRSEGCKILLYEFGGWIFLPLDGSTPEELLLNSEATQGVMQVTPSGNLNRGYKHCQLQIASGEDIPVHIGANQWQGVDPTWIGCTFLWREPSIELTYSLEDPYGNGIDLLGNASTQVFGSWSVWSDLWISPRGTAEYDFWLYGVSGEPVTGTWTLTAHHPGGAGFELNGYVTDDVSAWEGGAEFDDYRSNSKTVTWPATADSAFVLGSYSTRGYEQYIGAGTGGIQAGQISKFSGRGPRIDGVPILSVIAPGNYDVYSARSITGYPYTHGGWRQFSGTSAAGPHVAASAALALTADSTLTRSQIESLFETFAYRDNFTGSSYNDSAGYGKIRIDDLVAYLGVSEPSGNAPLPMSLSLSAYPNPFNATISLKVEIPVSGLVELRAYDLLGRKVATVFRGELAAGPQRLIWQAQDVPAGVYWIEAETGSGQKVQKVVVLK